MTERLTEEDRGKEVLFQSNRVGVVTDVEGDYVYVDPDFDTVPSNVAEEFEWDRNDDQHRFDQNYVTAVGNGQVRLRDDLLTA